MSGIDRKRRVRRIGRRGWLTAGMGALWLAALLLVALPAFRTSLQRQREVQELAAQLADLDAWTVAGLWLAPEVATRAVRLEPAWEAAFPRQRRREELFLEIARAADACGLEDFDLKEARQAEEQTGGPVLQQSLAADRGPGGSVYGVPVQVPQLELRTYRVKAGFATDYRGVSRFLGGLQRIDRALSVHDLSIRAEKGRLKVDLELDVYVSQTS